MEADEKGSGEVEKLKDELLKVYRERDRLQAEVREACDLLREPTSCGFERTKVPATWRARVIVFLSKARK